MSSHRPCPKCGARSTRIVWSPATIGKMAANGVLIPLCMIAGYFGDMRGFSFGLDHECEDCGARFVPDRFLRLRAKNG